MINNSNEESVVVVKKDIWRKALLSGLYHTICDML